MSFQRKKHLNGYPSVLLCRIKFIAVKHCTFHGKRNHSMHFVLKKMRSLSLDRIALLESFIISFFS
jgi:hypothetical protein